jgi:TetR/AcrR family transcriptional regulator, lmrAB and yxaGH operons repressor
MATEKPVKEQDGSDTRSRILHAAQRLFRKRGYHATGINDILALADAPKGSLYHHFPDGKEQIGVAVIESIAAGIIAMFSVSKARTTSALITQVGEQLVAAAEKTQYEICSMLSSFIAERKSSPKLGAAVAAAYAKMADALSDRMRMEGMSPRLAGDRAALIVATLEGGSLMAQAHQDASVFRLAVAQASALSRS